MSYLLAFAIWEQRKLIDIIKRVNKSSNSNELPKVEFEDIIAGEGSLNKDVKYKFDNRKGIVFEPHNILYGKLRPYLKNWLFTEFNGIALGDFWVFEPNNSDARFDYYLIQADKYQKVANDTSGTKMPRSDWKMVSTTLFSIPNIDEQSEIGSFFKLLDNTIALHQEKLDRYQQLKKTYVQLLFPQQNQTTPTLRFTAYQEEWQYRKLGEIVEIIGGGTPSTNNKEYWDGNIDWYSPTEIGKTIYAFESQRKITELGLKKSSAKILPANKTILFTSRAGIGDMAILKKDGATNQGFQSLVIKKECDIYFLYIMGDKIKNYALKNAAGSTFLEISGKELRKMDIIIPLLEEQSKIGAFFKQLDNIINLEQNKINNLIILKKSFLQKMFI